MFKKWLTSLFRDALKQIREDRKASGKQITEMTREQLGSIKPGISSLETLSEKGKVDMLASARRVYEEPAFLLVIRYLIESQKDYLAKYTDVDEKTHNLMARFTINGVCLVEETMEAMRSDFLDLVLNKDNPSNERDIL